MKRILIVEDETDIRESLQDLLTMKNFEVLTASNGKEGLFLASTQKPDLILSDIMMPEMNGFDFLNLIQKNSELVGIPFIFLSAKAEQTSLREGMKLGADDYLTKPVKNTELMDAINRRLAKAEAIRKSFEEGYNELLNQLNKTTQHEFNTPLNAILGFADLLKKKPNTSPDKISHFAEIIENSGNRLKTSLDNIILYRSLIVRSLQPKTECIPINQEFVERIVLQSTEKYNRGNDLFIETLDPHRIEGSTFYLQKILHELSDNAFKFSQPGDKVIVRAEVTNNHYAISIRDQGRGMTLDQINNIGAFNQFERTKYEQQGMGLGLFVSMEIARLHHWCIQLKPNEDKGITCSLVC